MGGCLLPRTCRDRHTGARDDGQIAGDARLHARTGVSRGAEGTFPSWWEIRRTGAKSANSIGARHPGRSQRKGAVPTAEQSSTSRAAHRGQGRMVEPAPSRPAGRMAQTGARHAGRRRPRGDRELSLLDCIGQDRRQCADRRARGDPNAGLPSQQWLVEGVPIDQNSVTIVGGRLLVSAVSH